MRCLSLSLISDCIFTGFTGFLLTLIISNFFLPAPYTFIISGVAGALLALAGAKLFTSRRGARIKDRAEREEYTKFVNRINLMKGPDLNSLLISAAARENIIAVKKREYIYLPEKKLALFPSFGYAEVKKADVVRAFNAVKKEDTAVILSETFSEDLITFAARFNGKIILVSGERLFLKLKESNSLPPETSALYDPPKEKPHILKRLTDKRKAKNYMLFGLAFFVLGLFSPFKLYYAVCGAILLLAALAVKFFGKQGGTEH